MGVQGTRFEPNFRNKLFVPPLQEYDKVDYMKLLSEKYGEDKQADGRAIYEDPDPNQTDNELSMSMDDSIINVGSLKGNRVDPHLRISQVEKLLLTSDSLTMMQRRSLVSRRNTAKLRLRHKQERDYTILV